MNHQVETQYPCGCIKYHYAPHGNPCRFPNCNGGIPVPRIATESCSECKKAVEAEKARINSWMSSDKTTKTTGKIRKIGEENWEKEKEDRGRDIGSRQAVKAFAQASGFTGADGSCRTPNR